MFWIPFIDGIYNYILNFENLLTWDEPWKIILEYILSLVRYKVHLRTFYFILFITYFTTIFLTHFYFLFFFIFFLFLSFQMGWDKENMVAYENTQSLLMDSDSSTLWQSTSTLILLHICDFSYFGLTWCHSYHFVSCMSKWTTSEVIIYHPSFFYCVLHIANNVQFRLKREVYFFSKSYILFLAS